jgi:hypothetical protein
MTVSGSADDLQELRQKLEALMVMLKEHEVKLAQPGEVMDAAGTCAREIADGKPNKLTLTTLLDAIGARAKSVTEVVSAVAAVKNLVAALL